MLFRWKFFCGKCLECNSTSALSGPTTPRLAQCQTPRPHCHSTSTFTSTSIAPYISTLHSSINSQLHTTIKMAGHNNCNSPTSMHQPQCNRSANTPLSLSSPSHGPGAGQILQYAYPSSLLPPSIPSTASRSMTSLPCIHFLLHRRASACLKS